MSKTVNTHGLQAENGEQFDPSVYTETTRATGTQQWVADEWAKGSLPTHSTSRNAVKLYTSTDNFRGFQYPDGRGMLEHYAHIQAIRTRSGLIIGDSSCYGKGWAHCSYPKNIDHKIDLTSLKSNISTDDESIYDITSVDDNEVTFESGRVYDMEAEEWTDPHPSDPTVGALGR